MKVLAQRVDALDKSQMRNLVDELRGKLGSGVVVLGAAAEGGVLPAHSVGWEKSAEAVTAQYDDRRGKETLTLLLYPTPMIAGSFAKAIKDRLGGMGPGFEQARVRREGELVALASGSFSGDDAQRLVDDSHLKQEVSFDKDVQPVFHTEVQKTASLLMSIAILSGVLMGAAVPVSYTHLPRAVPLRSFPSFCRAAQSPRIQRRDCARVARGSCC